MKIALVHDHLMEFGGAERVLVALKKIFPKADVYVSAFDNEVVQKNIPDFDEWNVRTSWASKIPFFKKLYSPLRFLAPHIWESFDLSKYDLVISSSGWFMSKGVITKPKTRHISYVHHQPRYLYYYETAVEWQRYTLVKIYAHFINHFLRIWDFTSSQRPDTLVVNSKETQRRVTKFYRRDSMVIHPPVDMPSNTDIDQITDKNDEYFVTVSRLTKTKNIDVLIKAANKYKFKLRIIGKGRDLAYLQSLAGAHVSFLGFVSDEDLHKTLVGAKGFLFAAVDEEFGIAPVESMGYGVPVIAYASGGLKEIVVNNKNGYLVDELSEEAYHEAIEKLRKLSSDDYKKMRKQAREQAEKYSFDNFKKGILAACGLK